MRICAGCNKPITGSRWLSSDFQDCDMGIFHDFECLRKKHNIEFYQQELAKLEK